MEGGSDLLPIVLFTGVSTDAGHPWPAPGEWWPIPGPGSDFRKTWQCRESAAYATLPQDSRIHMTPDSRLKTPYVSRLQTQDFILWIFTYGRTAPAVLGLPQKETGIMPRGFSHALPVRHATLSAARPTMQTGPRFRFRFIAKPLLN